MLAVGGLLIVALIIFIPIISQWGPLAWLLTPRRAKTGNAPNIAVWVNTRSGLYYCQDSPEYEKIEPGVHMKQNDALQKGYQPALHGICP